MQHDRPTEWLWSHASTLVHPQPEGQEMTTPDHAGIRARLAAATEGPWTAGLVPTEYDYDPAWSVDAQDGEPISHAYDEADAVLIARAPTDLAALLAERDDLAAENQRLRDTIQAAKAEAFETAFHALRDSGHSGGSIYVVETLMNEARAARGVSGE